MIAGYHLIWTAYGWWVPNDPRGSMSRTLRAVALADLGELHHGRRRVQPAYGDLQAFYERAADALKHPLLTFSEVEIELAGQALGHVVRERSYTCYACAVMPEHVHLLVRKHRDQAELMIERFQQATRDRLDELGRRDAAHPVWGGPGWKVYLETQDDIRRTVRYIEQNPVKARRPRQRWPFVSVYDGWLPGQVRIVRSKHKTRETASDERDAT